MVAVTGPLAATLRKHRKRHRIVQRLTRAYVTPAMRSERILYGDRRPRSRNIDFGSRLFEGGFHAAFDPEKKCLWADSSKEQPGWPSDESDVCLEGNPPPTRSCF